MNNYQLTNTSVYLGGQCKWDIVLSKNKNSALEVTDFNLTPISDSVPFNKKTHTPILKYPHSENFKNFYNNLKENFWDITPRISKYSRYDDTYLAGMKRVSQYSVYNKQFEYLQPVWLEKLDDGHSLAFDFTFYSVNSDGSRGDMLDHKVFNLSLNPSAGATHNDFVTYFYGWLEKLNIYKKGGNDKVFNVSFENSTAAIDGVSVISGQRVGRVSVDEIVQNIFQQERPLMESDYLFSTLFKTHNLVVSQLFNLNFCFNLVDIMDPFVISTLGGRNISADCRVIDSTTGLNTFFESRYLYTNYEYIRKNIACPYVNVLETIINPIQGTITETYQYNIDRSGVGGSDNVLNYLMDYRDDTLKDENKLSQPIVHWMYCDNDKKTFNLYEGFSGSVLEPSNHSTPTTGTPGISTTYDAKMYNVKSCNEIQIPEFVDKHAPGRGDFNWLNPGKLMLVDRTNPSLASAQSISEFKSFLTSLGKYMNTYNNYYGTSVDKIKQYWGAPSTTTTNTSSILCLYVSNEMDQGDFKNYLDEYNLYTEVLYGGEYGVDSFEMPLITYNSRFDTYLIISNDKDNLLIHNLNLIDPADSPIPSQQTPSERFLLFKSLLGEIMGVIENCNKGNYIGFARELVSYVNDQGIQSFYKSDDHVTFPYRTDGNLCPCMITDPTRPNYNYFLTTDGEKIVKGDNINRISQTQYIPETKWTDGGWCMSLFETLDITFTKDLTQPITTIKETVKTKLAEQYGIDANNQILIDYIYNLYDSQVKFDYASETDIEHIIYKVKLNLR